MDQVLRKTRLSNTRSTTVDTISAANVIEVLKPIWTDRRATAVVVRQRIRRVLGWCQAYGYATENVADARISAVMPSALTTKAHFRALPYKEVPSALVAVNGCGASLATRLCIRFLILTVARSKEARGATWSEIDMDDRSWLIPADRMKNREKHRQPLSAPALAVLMEARALEDGSGLVFPSPWNRGTGRILQKETLMDALRSVDLADRTTIHGLRSTFRDWASECTDADHAVKELALAHSVGSKVERAYFRGDLFEKRRELMEKWGAYACGSDMAARSGAPIQTSERRRRITLSSPS